MHSLYFRATIFGLVFFALSQSPGRTPMAQTLEQQRFPTLPRVSVDTSYPDTGKYAHVAEGPKANLQAAIDGARCATVLDLPAGATSMQAKPVVLPNKHCSATGSIIVRSPRVDVSLPAGIRVRPEQSPELT